MFMPFYVFIYACVAVVLCFLCGGCVGIDGVM